SPFAECRFDAPSGDFLSLAVRSDGPLRYQLTVVGRGMAPATCGNSEIELGEDCDGDDLGECPRGPCGVDCGCPAAVCGNGILERGEQCDDGNSSGSDGCSGSCKSETSSSCAGAPVIDAADGSVVVHGDTRGLANSGVGCGGRG